MGIIRNRTPKAVLEFLEFFWPADFIALCVIWIFETVGDGVGRDHFVDELGAAVVADFLKPAMENGVLSFGHCRLP